MNNMNAENPTTEDYRWGATWKGLQIGLWASESSIESDQPVALRAAVYNRSSDSIEVEPNFTLMVQWGKEKFAYGSGPRPAEPWLLSAGKFLEILGWQFQPPIGLDTIGGKFWVLYDSEEAKPLSSGIIEILQRRCHNENQRRTG
jgi:hypothetical protein